MRRLRTATVVGDLARRAVVTTLVALGVLRGWLARRRRSPVRRLGILNIEYYHERIGVFGGYGMTSRCIAEFFNSRPDGMKVKVLLNRPMTGRRPHSVDLDGTELIVNPHLSRPSATSVLRHHRLLRRANLDALLAIEYYSSYYYAALLQPSTPFVVWIHDPRPEDEWRKIATVELELRVNRQTLDGILSDRRYEVHTLGRLTALARRTGRDLIFATTAASLVDKARRAYELPDIEPAFLPIPVETPPDRSPRFSARPSFCFLGRLDPIKRPWIFFDVARRVPEADFLVAGRTHFPEAMNPIIAEYGGVPNLKFLGQVGGAAKDELLRETWGLINTSVHEALPVSFEEALSHGKAVISCQDPDGLVSEFGVYTGEFLGDGRPEATSAFCEAVQRVLTDRSRWMEKAEAAIRRMQERYSYASFAERLEVALGAPPPVPR